MNESESAQTGLSAEPTVHAGQPWVGRRSGLAFLCAVAGLILGNQLGIVPLDSASAPFGLQPMVYLAPIAVLAVVLERTRLRKALWTCWALIVLLALTVVTTPVFDGAMLSWIRQDRIQRAEAVVVLSASTGWTGLLNVAGFQRLLTGIDLALDGWAPVLVRTSNGNRPKDGDPDATALIKRYAPGMVVMTVGPDANTHDEAMQIQKLGFKKILLVTSPMHTRRSAATFEKLGFEVISVPAQDRDVVFEAPTGMARILGFKLYVRERVAWLLYKWRGWVD